jgi:predicted Zn-dependent protease with MMP-like domain
MPVDLEPAAFEALVEQALDAIPDEIAAVVRNVVVLVEDEPPADDPGLLGLYDGFSMTERDDGLGGYGAHLPDRIFVFRNPLLEMCETLTELEQEVRVTVVHEVAHHFGIDDRRLHELGYG